MDAKAELADFVEAHLSRGADVATVCIGSICAGLASLASAFSDAQERHGNWGEMLGKLRSGLAAIEPALPVLQAQNDASIAKLISFAVRQRDFALLMESEIIRLQAGESTNV